MSIFTRYTGLAVVLGASMALPATAGTNILQARVTPLGYGDYEIDLGSLGSVDGDYLSTDLGVTFIRAFEDSTAIVADLELEYFQVDTDGGGDFDRTDLKFSLGYKTQIGLTPFAGFRLANQGDGLFDDGDAKEDGFFIGASYSSIPVGDIGGLTLSLAYNFNSYEITTPGFQGTEFDTAGLSGKLSFLLSSIPVAFNLKYQSFSEDEDIGGSFQEDYLTLLSVTWYFWSGVMGE